MQKQLVVIGNGMAGMRVVEHLLDFAPDQYEITVFGEEPHGNYNRIQLSPVLAGDKTIADIMLNTPEWYVEHNITLHAGDPVVSIDRQAKTVTSANGQQVHYDRLLIATGSKPFIIPIPGHDLPGVISFREIKDVDTMLAGQGRTIVIGGGLLGLEAAHGLNLRGRDVTVVHRSDYLMERQLDPTAAALLQDFMQQQGIDFCMGANSSKILGEDSVAGLQFDTGEIVEGDLLVMTAGVVPNIALAKAAGLSCERGILVNDVMQTFDPSIYAVGECVQHRGLCYGLVAPLWDQALTCANQLAEQGTQHYQGSVTATTLKVSGVDLYSAGDFNGSDDDDVLTLHDHPNAIYKKLVIREGVLIGALLYGEVADGPWYFQLIQQQTHVAAVRDRLIFGKAYVDETLLEPQRHLPSAA